MIYFFPTDTCYWIWCNINDEKCYFDIYKLKNRNLDKPLAILIRNFLDLEKYTNLTQEQIEFLKKYPHPFTILTDINNNFVLPDFLDRSIYKKIAFRIWENAVSNEILNKIDLPFFLTSANISNEKELYSSKEVEIAFKNYLEEVKILNWNIPYNKPSDIFEFIGKSVKINHIRKNY